MLKIKGYIIPDAKPKQEQIYACSSGLNGPYVISIDFRIGILHILYKRIYF